ncbi:HAD family phosphatase [Candidatus Woesearchaeota archaeon]|nr:HAD family phosphatase [Candidatus Woesearchaeota archaeon]
MADFVNNNTGIALPKGAEVTYVTKDNKVIVYKDNTGSYAHINNPNAKCTYPLLNSTIQKPVKAVMMDMDGSSTDTEKLVLVALRKMMAEAVGVANFDFKPEDMQHIMGDSTSNHISYLIKEYDLDPKKARNYENTYYKNYHCSLHEIRDGKAPGLVQPMPHLKEFLLYLKKNDTKIGLVTSSLQDEMEIVMDEVFRVMDMGCNFRDFYDGIISAGIQGRKGKIGTLGELCLKPHPWLYSDMGQRLLGMSKDERENCVVIEDSTAGIVAGRLAGYPVIWVPHGDNESHDAWFATHKAMGGLSEIIKYDFWAK